MASCQQISIRAVLACCLFGSGIGEDGLLGQPTAEERAAVEGRYRKLKQKRDDLDRTVWAKELEAQRYEQAFVSLWDTLRSASDKR